MDELAPEVELVIHSIADDTARRYREFVDGNDVRQELTAYYFGHRKQLDKWRLADQFRFKRGLYGAAKQYCEREKATKTGYEFDDIAWYEPAQLAHLIPLVFNSNWDGLSGDSVDAGMPRGKSPASEGGTLLTMICDIRRVLRGKKLQAADFDPASERGVQNLQRLCEWLGGSFPAAPGYVPGRKVAA